MIANEKLFFFNETLLLAKEKGSQREREKGRGNICVFTYLYFA